MLMLGLSEAIDQLAMANSAHWYGYVLRREDGYVLRREDACVFWREDACVLRREDGHVSRMALDFKVDGQKNKGRLKRTLKSS